MTKIETVIIDYIEKNKKEYNISYEESLNYLQEVLDSTRKDYEKMKGER